MDTKPKKVMWMCFLLFFSNQEFGVICIHIILDIQANAKFTIQEMQHIHEYTNVFVAAHCGLHYISFSTVFNARLVFSSMNLMRKNSNDKMKTYDCVKIRYNAKIANIISIEYTWNEIVKHLNIFIFRKLVHHLLPVE